MSRTFHHGDKAKQRRFGSRWRWMKDPSWWIHDMMTVKQRAQVRTLLSKVYKLHDLECAPEFPLAKKPHQYYW